MGGERQLEKSLWSFTKPLRCWNFLTRCMYHCGHFKYFIKDEKQIIYIHPASHGKGPKATWASGVWGPYVKTSPDVKCFVFLEDGCYTTPMMLSLMPFISF